MTMFHQDLQIYPPWLDIVIHLEHSFAAIFLLRLENHTSRRACRNQYQYYRQTGGIKLSDFGKEDYIRETACR